MRSRDPADGGAVAWPRARQLFGMAIERRETFGEYVLVGWLGAGATANVYRARRGDDGQIVALKIMRDAYGATPAELRRFRAGAAAAATLDHPHVVRVVDYGERGEEPFVATDLVEGETLEQRLDREPPPAEEAARLMLAVAEGVAHAHDRGVVHRDLKPANILVDRAGSPRVADFGLAKRVDLTGSGAVATLGAGALVGAPAYMAPEVIDGDCTRPQAADVYSLGVIFYQLLTGQLPFAGRSVDELFAQIRAGDPVPPRALRPAIAPAYEDVCLTCLAGDPARRFGSARALARDLERVRDGRRPLARGPTFGTRALRTVRRHPRAAAGVAVALVAAVTAVAVTAALWRADARERARALRTNSFIASGQAGALLFQLRAYGDRVESVARQPIVRALLEGGRPIDPVPQLAALADGFDGVYLESAEGRLLAQWPSPAREVFERRFLFRDYFQGARKLAQAGAAGVYVARAFRSESHGLMEFAISTPVLDDRGRQIGMLAAAFRAKQAFGAVRMEAGAGGDSGSGVERITTALLGPRGSDRGDGPDGPTPSRFTFLVHPGLAQGAEYTVETPPRMRDAFGPPAPPGEQLALQYVRPFELPDYRDPIPGFSGRWLAAFAPVGRTGFVVLVETRCPDALGWSAALALPVTAAFAAALLAASGWLAVRRRQPAARARRSAARTR
jgi:hypothetical protein